MEIPCKKCSTDAAFCCGCVDYTNWKKQENIMTEQMQIIIDNTPFYGLSSPEDIVMSDFAGQIQLLISEIESKFRKKEVLRISGNLHVSINGERYSKDVRDAVCELYIREGWSKVTNQTSSENGERPGLTGFEFIH